jgi:hypothetical protein
LYCGVACSRSAREESVRRAHVKFNDRDCEEGREVHRLEEADRRERRARERVGDHRLHDVIGRLKVPTSAAHQAAVEASDATLVAPVGSLNLEAPKACGVSAEPQAGDAPAPAPTEWILVAWPGLLLAARRRLGANASCPFCGRHGRIARVVSLDRWRRQIRYGFG